MLVIAHRGASGEYPENTLLAFEKAIEQQADGIELDVQRHPDGTLFLLHDRFFDKYSSGSGHFSTLTSAQIAELRIMPNQAIATLKQALACIKGRCLVNIELKCASSDDQEVRDLLEQVNVEIECAIDQYGFNSSQFVISSFNHYLLHAAALILPNIKTAALIACAPLSITALVDGLNPLSVNPSVECLNDNLVNQCRAANIEVWVYTVDQAYDIAKCQSLGVDAIFTNFPARTRQIIRKN